MALLPLRGPVTPHPQDVPVEACLNCGSRSLYGDVCARCGLCQRCDELVSDNCYCEAPTALERFDAAMEGDW